MDNKDSVVIDIYNNNNSASTSEKYFCNYCNSKLFPYTREDMIGAYMCIKCTIQYWPKQQPVKKLSKFNLPGPSTDLDENVTGDNDIPIAMLDTPEASSTAYKQKNYHQLTRF